MGQYGHPGAEIDPQRTKVRGAGGMRRAAEDVSPPGDFEIDKTGGHDRVLELCFQQSAGNSTCPQVYPVFRAF